MQISQTIDLLRANLKEPLPGYTSHIKMAPNHRKMELMQTDFKKFKPKLSAVVILLFPEKDGLKISFIRRSNHVRMHPGQIAFPGGRYDEEDKDLQTTAMREMQEEIGIHPDEVDILGSLTDLYVPPSNFIVRAYLAYMDKPPVFKLQPSEVQEVISLNLDAFNNPKHIKTKSFNSFNTNETIDAPCFEIGEIVIWGATAMMLTELLDILNC